MKKIICLFIFSASFLLFTGLCQASMTILTSESPNHLVKSGNEETIFGTSTSNRIAIESGAKAKLINFPGQNVIEIRSSSDLFAVTRSGTVVTFQGSDGTLLKIPATADAQTISFLDKVLTLSIYQGKVMLDDRIITPDIVDASADIGPKGGVVEVTNPQSQIFGAKIEIPDNCIEGNEIITLSEPSNMPEIPKYFTNFSKIVEFGPSGINFKEKVTISIPYDEKDIDENDMTVMVYSGNPPVWEPADIVDIDFANNIIKISTTHFSGAAVVSGFVNMAGTTLRLIGSLNDVKNIVIAEMNSDANGIYVITDTGEKYYYEDGVVKINDENGKEKIYCVKKAEKNDPHIIFKIVDFGISIATSPFGINAVTVAKFGEAVLKWYAENNRLCQIGYNYAYRDQYCSSLDYTWDYHKVPLAIYDDGKKLELGVNIGYPTGVQETSYLIIENPDENLELWRDRLEADKVKIECRIGEQLVVGFDLFDVAHNRKILEIPRSIFDEKVYSDGQYFQILVKYYKDGNYIGSISNMDDESNECLACDDGDCGSSIIESWERDGLDTSKWYPNLYGKGANVEINNSDAALAVSNNLGGQATLISNYYLNGDFDIQVDFNILDWPSNPERHDVQLDFQIGYGGASDRIIIGIAPSGSSPSKYYFTTMQKDLNWYGKPKVYTEDGSGIFRIKRINNVTSTYFWNWDQNNWQMIGEFLHDIGSQPVHMILYNGDYSGGGGVIPKAAKAVFNNYIRRY